MLTTGLVSVTFRKLSIERIVELVQTAKLDSIEWGGDVHVPHGDLKQAQRVAQLTRDNGLSVSAYGSYYRMAESDSPPIDAVLDTAQALGTDLVRVWAGRRGSDVADTDYRQAVIDDAQNITEQAEQCNLTICLEYHHNTLTDTLASTVALMNAVDSDHFKTFWQPPHTTDMGTKLSGLRTLLPQLTSVHVFHWQPETRARYPLANGIADWRQYIDILRTSPNNHVLSLEFVADDDPDNFLRDAETLHTLLDA